MKGREKMISKSSRTILVCVIGLVVASESLAVHVFNPPWVTNPNDPQWQGGVTTSQVWEFAQGGPSLVEPAHVSNPFGPPQIRFQNTTAELVTDFPQQYGGPNVWTWHVDVDGGGVFLDIHNNPEPLFHKVIHLQYTSDKAGGVPSTNPPGTASAGGVAGLGGAWYTYEWTIEIQPNPNFETIFIPFPASSNIEEIEVNTICVPEPTSLIGLGLGGLAMLRRRRA